MSQQQSQNFAAHDPWRLEPAGVGESLPAQGFRLLTPAPTLKERFMRVTRVPRSAVILAVVLALLVLAWAGVSAAANTQVLPAESDGFTSDLAATGGAESAAANNVKNDGSGSGGNASPGKQSKVFVHVIGAVKNAGVFELDPGKRVTDAIQAAGGLTSDAAPAGLNLARVLTDGEQIVVPTAAELAAGAVTPPQSGSSAGGAGAAPANSGGGRISLNSATAQDLDSLPKIGPALAQRIIDWREKNGGFKQIEQLLEVSGIGDAVLAQIADKVSI